MPAKSVRAIERRSRFVALGTGLYRCWLPFIIVCICLLASAGPRVAGQSSDEEKRLRDLFLKSRQEMQVLPSPSASPSPKPTPAPSPKRSITPAVPAKRTPEEETSPTPEATPAQRATSAVKTPPPAPSPAQPPPPSTATPAKKRGWWIFGHQNKPIVIQKSGAEQESEQVPVDHPTGDGGWHYLTPAVRKAIDDARVGRNRWKYIIVHNSGTRQGNARIFDYYHRHVRHMPNGLAYHFVIGNGGSSGDGQIEIGNRWVYQIAGGHVHSDYLNYISIGICLVGDFNRDLPTRAQYEALDELIRYLRQRVGKIDGRYSTIRGHKEINPVPTDCPGNRFPLNWLHHTFPD